MVKRSIKNMALWKFPPSPAKRNTIEFTSEYMNEVIVPTLQDELAASGITRHFAYFLRPKADRIDDLNQLISTSVDPLIYRLVDIYALNELIAECHPLLRDGLDELMRVYLQDLRPRVVTAIRGSEHFREVGSADAFGWRDDISDSYSIVDSDSESQRDFDVKMAEENDDIGKQEAGQSEQETDDVRGLLLIPRV